MEWYLLAGMSDIPKIDVRLKDQPERGVIGIGEPPTVPTAAAIALAVRNAIGVTVRSLPLTPARILQALQQQHATADRSAYEAFAYVNPTNEKDAVAALSPEFEKSLPIGGGQDLLARMKDYITQPDRIVNVKGALEATVTPRERRPADRRGDEDGRSRRARRDRAAVSRDRRGGDRSRHAADPQSGHGRRQPQSAAALLVLPQRRVRLLQEGRQHAASRPRARTSSTPSSAAARASSCTRRAWRCRWSPTARRSASLGPNGERLVPAADYFTLPVAERADGERARAERAADARDPAGARQREERPLRGALQDVARLADRLRDRAARR